MRRVWLLLWDAVAKLFSRQRRDAEVVREAEPARAEVDPFAAAPAELWEFFREAPTMVRDELGIHPLTEAESLTYSRALHKFAFGERLGLVALDDANDSNPFCLVTKGLLRGAVLHLVHDDAPRIRFYSLAAYRRSLVDAHDQGLHIDDLPVPELQPFVDQSALANLLAGLGGEAGDWAVEQLCLFVPLLVPQDPVLLARLATHKDMFVREAVAELLAYRPRRGLEAVAQRLAADAYRQIADPARRAIERMRDVPPT